MIIMKDLHTTNFANDVKRLLSWFFSNIKDKDNSKIRGFFSRVFREMKK